jgi:hypothetical protein
MADSPAKQRFIQAMQSPSASRMLAEFLQERRQDALELLASATPATFQTQQGRVAELDQLLKIVTK